MINRNSTIGKMIDNTKVVYQCLRCSRQFVGDKDTNLQHCPKCKHESEKVEPQLVIVENLIVRK